MIILDEATVAKATKFLGNESIFCTMKGILKKPVKDTNTSGEIFYKFNLRVTNKEGYAQTFACIVPATQTHNFLEKDFLAMKDMEVIVIPSLSNHLNEWKSEETGKKGTNNRLTLYVSRIAVVGEGESNRTFDEELGVNW